MKFRLTASLAAALCVLAVTAQAAAPRLYPVDVVRSGDELRKIYELEPGENPNEIPTASFTQGGLTYQLADILRAEQATEESKPYTEPVTAQSNTKDADKVLALFAPEKEVTTEDGFTGILTLDTATIKIEPSGYGSSSKTVTASRNYPNLASQDSSNIPKSITENGRTLILQNLQWQTDNTANVDDYSIGDRYTALATYTGTATSSYVKGYTVTADYTGEVVKVQEGKTRYTAIFLAEVPVEPTPPPETPPAVETPAPEKPAPFPWQYLILPLGGVLLVAGGILGGRKLLKNRKEQIDYETDTDTSPDPEPVHYPGVGDGV